MHWPRPRVRLLHEQFGEEEHRDQRLQNERALRMKNSVGDGDDAVELIAAEEKLNTVMPTIRDRRAHAQRPSVTIASDAAISRKRRARSRRPPS